MGGSASRRGTAAPRREMDLALDLDDSSSDQEPSITTIFQFLIRRLAESGQVRIITAEGCTNQRDSLVDSDDELQSPESYSRPDLQPDTTTLDASELRQIMLHERGHYLPAYQKRPSSVTSMFVQREMGMLGSQQFTARDRCVLTSNILPQTMEVISKYNHKAFCGTYSLDGNLFLTAAQDRNIRLYSTKHDTFVPLKTVPALDVGWSILDTAFSPDCRHIIYSSWSEAIHLCKITDDDVDQEVLYMSPEDRRFCIFSLVFSHGGNEILGGANDGYLYVYDIEEKQRVLRIYAHEDDVNTVAFADNTSQIFFSGGDDGLLKVWDRRCLNESDPHPVGLLAGHRDGITFVDPRGDGRHLITNSKDQTIKLWDMRAFSNREAEDNTRRAVSMQRWDYRWQKVPRKLLNSRQPMSGDTSLMTYVGHSVLQTLIRARFSPAETTGQQYIYSGCALGRVVIYDVLTGKIECILRGHRACVRDVSWHPQRPELVSTSWDGTIARWKCEGQDDMPQPKNASKRSSTCRSRSSSRKRTPTSGPTHTYSLRKRQSR